MKPLHSLALCLVFSLNAIVGLSAHQRSLNCGKTLNALGVSAVPPGLLILTVVEAIILIRSVFFS